MSYLTIIGNLTADPEIRFTPQGKAVANFTIAEPHRIKVNGEWKDGQSTFWNCQLWDTAAENLAESLKRGQRVIAYGEAKQRSYETNDGQKRTVIEVTVSEIGPSLRWATAKVERTAKTGPRPSQPADDPWASAPQDDDTAPF